MYSCQLKTRKIKKQQLVCCLMHSPLYRLLSILTSTEAITLPFQETFRVAALL